MVNLYFETFTLVIPKYKIPRKIIRLVGYIKFVKEKGAFTKNIKAIIDTGAHTSVIPLSLWRDITKKILIDHILFGGVNPKEECQIPASLGIVRCSLIDEDKNHTPELGVSAFLAKTDNVSVIPGFADLSERFNICFDYRKNRAYIEEKC